VRTTRAALVRRLWRAVAAQIARAEAYFEAMTDETGESLARPEEAAKLLASLARTLKELDALEPADRRSEASDDSPRDIEAFRAELARKLDRLLAGKPDPDAAGGSDRDGH
jgi:hypothetical protein